MVSSESNVRPLKIGGNNMKKIQKYLKHSKSFLESRGKRIILKDLYQEMMLLGLKQGIKSFLHKRYLKDLYGNNWEQIILIKDSGMFDSDFYLEQYPDVRKSGMDPLLHYYHHGWREGRNPNSVFNSNYYQNKYNKDDLLDPLTHYILFGQKIKYKINELSSITFDDAFGKELDAIDCRAAMLLIVDTFAEEQDTLLTLSIARKLYELNYKTIIVIGLVRGNLFDVFNSFCLVKCIEQDYQDSVQNDCYLDVLFQGFYSRAIDKCLTVAKFGYLFIPYLEKFGFKYQIVIHDYSEYCSDKYYSEINSALLKISNGEIISTASNISNFLYLNVCFHEIADTTLNYTKQVPEESIVDYYIQLLSKCFCFQPTISVIVPNFNYAQYLRQRLLSIINQSYKPLEIIFLDDNSSDDSSILAEHLLLSSGVSYRILKNDKNQGVFKQWVKGIKLARGQLVWIAEADDFCDLMLLENLSKYFIDNDVGIAYCQSRLVNSLGEQTQENILSHTNDIDINKWRKAYKIFGHKELRDSFIYRNIIVNSGSCLIRRSCITDAIMSELASYNYCGDWYLYSQICLNSNLAYYEVPLNSFRRHEGAVTNKFRNQDDYLNEILSILSFILKNIKINQDVLNKVSEFILRDYNFNDRTVNLGINNLSKLVYPADRVLFVSLNPSTQVGGGDYVLWVDAIYHMLEAGIDVAIVIWSRDILPKVIASLISKSVEVFFFNETRFGVLDKFIPDKVVLIQGDHNEGAEWAVECLNRGVNYFIVNQLTKEGWWSDDFCAEKIINSYLKAEKVFFTCENNKLLMERQLGTLLPNSVRHCNPVAGIEYHSIMPFPKVVNGEFHLACPSRLLTIHKGQDLLFEILRKEKWKNRKLIINLYGNGPNKLQLERLKEYYAIENIRFCGYVNDVKDIWLHNHGIIMPSRMEGVPIVLIGAMLCSRVPILADVGGHKELVQNNYSGFIAKAPTVDLIEEALEEAWSRRMDWANIGANARDSVLCFQSACPVEDFVATILAS